MNPRLHLETLFIKPVSFDSNAFVKFTITANIASLRKITFLPFPLKVS